MTPVDQRTACSWRLVQNVGSKLVQHQHVLYKNWKAIPFILLALSLGQQKEMYQKMGFFLFRWLNNIEPKLMVEQ